MTNYSDIDDNELINSTSYTDEEKRDIFYQKYHYLVIILITKYDKLIKEYNIDYNEIYEEANIGFSDGLNSYIDNKDTSLKTFLSICIQRKINKYLRKVMSKKNNTLRNMVSLDTNLYDNLTIKDSLKASNIFDPLINLSNNELVKEINEFTSKELSSLEKDVLHLYLEGKNYNEIANILDKTPKQVDNTIQRIKNKIKLFISSY